MVKSPSAAKARATTLLLATSHAAAANTFKQTNNRIFSNGKYKWELDADAMLALSTFPIKPKDLIQRAKEVIDNQVGVDKPDDLAEDFIFQFPVVGPLTKDQYITAVSGFKLKDAFPDFNPGVHNFYVDPYEPNRVWYFTRFIATHSGDAPPPFGKATHKPVECPPQAVSLTFNEQGKVTLYTGGYVMDKLQGNSGGMGGIFGPLYAVGKGLPFPEAKPWSPSLRYRLFTFVGRLVSRLQRKKGTSHASRDVREPFLESKI